MCVYIYTFLCHFHTIFIIADFYLQNVSPELREPVVEVQDPWTEQSHHSINSETRAFTVNATT